MSLTLLADTSIYLINNIIKPHFETVGLATLYAKGCHLYQQSEQYHPSCRMEPLFPMKEPTHWQSVKLMPTSDADDDLVG